MDAEGLLEDVYNREVLRAILHAHAYQQKYIRTVTRAKEAPKDDIPGQQ